MELRAGIVLLSLTSAVVYGVFSGNTSTLLPLYAVGVFLAFTLSQTGMVVHWRRHRDQPHWRKSLVVNATGASPAGCGARWTRCPGWSSSACRSTWRTDDRRWPSCRLNSDRPE